MSVLRNQAQRVWEESLLLPPRDYAVDYLSRKVFLLELVTLFIPPLSKYRTKFWLYRVRYWGKRLTGEERMNCFSLLAKKNELYGNTQLYKMGTFGILFRSGDKVERVKNLEKGVHNDLVLTESKRDSLMDLFNYAILSVLVIRKEL